MDKQKIDAFVHHIAEAQRVLHDAAKEVSLEVKEGKPHLRFGTFDKQEAQEWNQIANASSGLVEVKDEIVELTPADAPHV